MKHILVTGGAGFIGSHLCEQLVHAGNNVTIVDNFITGSKNNISKLIGNSLVTVIEGDVSNPVSSYLKADERFDWIYHMASPASPKGYQENAIETYKVNAWGTHYLAEFATQTGARLLFASTSEVYGDPLEHPQKETYWGNVNIRGVRSCYDESKRFGEMVQTVWQREKGLDIRTVRIFNTYGPRMNPEDGRIIPNFMSQALKGKPITVYGDGSQTRSFCYVSDLVMGLMMVMESEKARGEVYNLGNPDEYTVLSFAQIIKKTLGADSQIVFEELPQDDPTRRRPDISKVKEEFGWSPLVSLEDGLVKTIEYFRQELGV